MKQLHTAICRTGLCHFKITCFSTCGTCLLFCQKTKRTFWFIGPCLDINNEQSFTNWANALYETLALNA